MTKPQRAINSHPEHEADSDAESNAGMFDGFEAYKTPTDSEYTRLLTEGTVVPDANVFLNLYRYNEQTRNVLIGVLRKLGDRLWVPNQVMAEFWRNRETVLQDPRATTSTLQDLESQRDKSTNTLRSWSNRVNLSPARSDELVSKLREAYEAVNEGVRELADEAASDFARDTNSDPVLLELAPILSGRVGQAMDSESHKEAMAEAKSRLDAKRPPGFKDAAKDPILAAGDCLIWLQTIRHAQVDKKDVLFVTGDIKEDWWRREHGESRGPLPELVKEMRERASVRLYMLRTESMILKARQALEIDISDESVKDIGRIDNLAVSLDPGSAVDDFSEIIARWEAILEAVRDRRKVAWILLSNVTPDSLDSSFLTINFSRDGDAKGFIGNGCDRDLTAALAESTNLVRRIRAISPSGRVYEADLGESRSLAPGNLVNHDTYGLGRVISVEGPSRDPEAAIDFGDEIGVKHLLLRYAPMHRL